MPAVASGDHRSVATRGAAPDAARLPEPARTKTEIMGVSLPRIAVGEPGSARALLWSWFSSEFAEL